MREPRQAYCEFIHHDVCWKALATVSYDGNGRYNMKIDSDTITYNDEDYIGQLPDHVKEGLIDSIDVMRLFKEQD